MIVDFPQLLGPTSTFLGPSFTEKFLRALYSLNSILVIVSVRSISSLLARRRRRLFQHFIAIG
jgi:hypothetical protein